MLVSFTREVSYRGRDGFFFPRDSRAAEGREERRGRGREAGRGGGELVRKELVLHKRKTDRYTKYVSIKPPAVWVE